MRRHPRIFGAAALIAWVGCCLLPRIAPADAANEPPSGVSASGSGMVEFDRAALEKELARPLESLAEQSSEALRAYVQRLGDLHFALELSVDVSPAERRALSEQILTRVGRVGLLIRQRAGQPHAPGKGQGQPATAPGAPPAGDLTGVLLDNSGLLLRLLAGVLIAFALGYLVRDRRAAKPVAAVTRVNRGQEFPAPVPIPREVPAEGRPMTLTEIRQALHSGHTVLLQMGYEITPSHRRQFLALAQEAQDILNGIDGQTYTVWEDPGHPNRFYELLVFRRLEVLDQLASTEGPLPGLAEEIEACRVPSGFSLHRAWLGALPDAQGAPRLGPAPEGWLVGQRVD